MQGIGTDRGSGHGGTVARGNGRVSKPLARPRLFIDGYNLALDQGTGVATYARNLSFALGRLGFGVGVLYGTRPTHSVEPLIREIAFFDERGAKRPNGSRSCAGRTGW